MKTRSAAFWAPLLFSVALMVGAPGCRALNEAKQRNVQLEAEVRSLRMENADLQAKITDLTAQVNQLRAENEDLKAQNQKLLSRGKGGKRAGR